MPRKIGALVCLALAIIARCAWVLGQGQTPANPLPAVAGAGEGTYSLATEFPEVQDSYTLYRVVPVTITEDRVREIAEWFGLSGESKAVSEVTGEFLLVDVSKEPEEQVSVYAHSGAVAYHILDLELPTEVTQQPDLPTNAEGRRSGNPAAANRRCRMTSPRQSGSAGRSTGCRSTAMNSRRSWATAVRSSDSRRPGGRWHRMGMSASGLPRRGSSEIRPSSPVFKGP
ncbi:MAG: Calcium-dependent protein kinase [Methanocalculus sp. 52_23]|nr:MAG: Calcium-dependent protein kinase [Methanocalculus sp. 52_23]